MNEPLSAPDSTASSAETAPPGGREWSTRAFLLFLGVITCVYAVILIYHVARPPGTVAVDDNFLEQCRQICLKYGLVSTGNIRQDAEAYLTAVKSRPVTAGLHELLSEPGFVPVATKLHPLVQTPAPDFSLLDDAGNTRSLTELASQRPVVLVFYLGYGCSHCVAQLLAIDKDLHYFRELDAEVIAVSQDSHEHTASRFREFGRFGFPVLSDPDNQTAAKWGVYSPSTDDADEERLHGTFVIDRNGVVIWADFGNEPFLNNRSLLQTIAESQGLLPEPEAAAELTRSTP